eukprot:m.8442 g.8442  ORF g.8442 m.8442 type:complete len:818 (+) comp3896_c0_seq1:1044-3497(+)
MTELLQFIPPLDLDFNITELKEHLFGFGDAVVDLLSGMRIGCARKKTLDTLGMADLIRKLGPFGDSIAEAFFMEGCNFHLTFCDRLEVTLGDDNEEAIDTIMEEAQFFRSVFGLELFTDLTRRERRSTGACEAETKKIPQGAMAIEIFGLLDIISRLGQRKNFNKFKKKIKKKFVSLLGKVPDYLSRIVPNFFGVKLKFDLPKINPVMVVGEGFLRIKQGISPLSAQVTFSPLHLPYNRVYDNYWYIRNFVKYCNARDKRDYLKAIMRKYADFKKDIRSDIAVLAVKTIWGNKIRASQAMMKIKRRAPFKEYDGKDTPTLEDLEGNYEKNVNKFIARYTGKLTQSEEKTLASYRRNHAEQDEILLDNLIKEYDELLEKYIHDVWDKHPDMQKEELVTSVVDEVVNLKWSVLLRHDEVREQFLRSFQWHYLGGNLFGSGWSIKLGLETIKSSVKGYDMISGGIEFPFVDFSATHEIAKNPQDAFNPFFDTMAQFDFGLGIDGFKFFTTLAYYLESNRKGAFTLQFSYSGFAAALIDFTSCLRVSHPIRTCVGRHADLSSFCIGLGFDYWPGHPEIAEPLPVNAKCPRCSKTLNTELDESQEKCVCKQGFYEKLGRCKKLASCEPGYYPEKDECKPCSVGKYRNTSCNSYDTSKCMKIRCDQGEYVDAKNRISNSCLACEEGKYQNESNHTRTSCRARSVSECPAGKRFAPGNSSSDAKCIDCDLGFYQDQRDHQETSCKPLSTFCQRDEYFGVGTIIQDTCNKCPNGQFQDAINHTNAACQCYASGTPCEMGIGCKTCCVLCCDTAIPDANQTYKCGL